MSQGRLVAWLRRLSLRRRVPLRWLRMRLAWLRWLWLRRLRLLLAMGPLPHLLKGTQYKAPATWAAGATLLALRIDAAPPRPAGDVSGSSAFT
jgi:hypothetical protein